MKDLKFNKNRMPMLSKNSLSKKEKNKFLTSFLEKTKQKLTHEKKIILTVKVTPKSGKHEITTILENGTLKIKLQASPEQNKANTELIDLLSKFFETSPQKIKILSGQKSPLKTIQIDL